MKLLRCFLLCCLCASLSSVSAQEPVAETREVKQLLDRRAELRLKLLKLRSEAIANEPELQELKRKIDLLYAEMHEKLLDDPNIAKAQKSLERVEQDLQAKIRGREEEQSEQ